MKKFKGFSLILLLILSLSCSTSYAASYYYATTDMTWAEFYEGETGESRASLLSQGLDAFSTPTIAAAGSRNLFPQLDFTIDEANSTTTFRGIKDVQVRMTEDVYNALTDKSRYKFVDTEFTEYKDVNPDGTFGKMIEASTTTLTNSVTALSGSSATWGNYVLEISDAASSITIGSGDTRYWLGALVETDGGKIYGMRHDSNLWRTPDDIALSVAAFTEPHGVTRDFKYTSDIAGKTVKKITYILKDAPDIVINCNAALKNQTTATVKAEEPALEDEGFLINGGDKKITMTFNNLPSGTVYNLTSLYTGSRRTRQDITDYEYSGGVLTIKNAAAGSYTAVFTSDNYVDISATFTLYDTNATSSIISPDNNLGNVNFLITPAGAMSAVDKEMEDGNFIAASECTDPANNYSNVYSGANVISGSGFTFDITLEDVPDGKTAVAGFGKIFNLTPENFGSERFSKAYSGISQLEVYPSGFRSISGNQFKDYGLRIMGIYDGERIDVTQYVGAGAMIIDTETIMIYYGVMLADCDYGEINEGATYLFSPEGETLVSDRNRDGHLKLTWYFEAIENSVLGSSSSGCNALNLAPAMMFALMIMIAKKR